jgi:hypothetical protein
MAHVFPNDRGAEAGYYVHRLPLRERSTWYHQRFLTSEEYL